MYDGTLYGHWQAIVCFQQMIVLCDADGVVDMTPQAMAARTSIPLEIIQKGLEILEQSDPYTRTPGEDGKRITRLDDHRPWGWKIVNHAHYKYLVDTETVKAQNRERQRRHREKTGQEDDVTACHAPSQTITPVTACHAPSLHADADADAIGGEAPPPSKTNSRPKPPKPGPRKSKSTLPEGFSLDAELRDYAEAKLPDADVAAIFDDFRGKAVASGWAYIDWRQAWQNFIRSAAPGSGHWSAGQYQRRAGAQRRDRGVVV